METVFREIAQNQMEDAEFLGLPIVTVSVSKEVLFREFSNKTYFSDKVIPTCEVFELLFYCPLF